MQGSVGGISGPSGMKFGKEFSSQMVPEWQEAYMNYDDLKTLLKEIQRMKQENKPVPPKPTPLERPMTLCRAFSGLLQRQLSIQSKKDHNLSIPSKKDHNLSIPSKKDHSSLSALSRKDIEGHFIPVKSLAKNGAEGYETLVLRLGEEGEEKEQEFFRRLDEEFNKVKKFYEDKVQEVVAEAEILSKQMDVLIAFRAKRNKMQGSTQFGTAKSSRVNPMDASNEGQSHEKVQKNKSRSSKQVPLEVLNHVKLNNTLDTPTAIIKGIVHSPELTEETITSENLKNVEKQLKRAFVEFYRKIRHLKGFSFMNILAFSKIMKKYDKITSRKASESYMKMVDKSYLGNSDEVTKLIERVEAVFVKHFSNSNRSKGMDILRPKAKRERHRTSFSLGFFSGCSFALVLALLFVIHARDVMNQKERSQYMETMFPLYSFFGFIVLHMAMYAVNIYFWQQYRVNYSFIFGFKPGSELSYREVLLVSFGLAGLALASVLSNLDMEMDPDTYDYQDLTELLPLGLVLLVVGVLICPFNIMYRSSRIFFLTCLFHCLLAPLYKVTLQDFFLADQLTSQVQSLRSLEFYVCYYGWGGYALRENTCKTNSVYNTFYFIVAVLPYVSRFLQCMRRLYDEGDRMQGYNGLKYMVTIIAICTRTAYGFYKGLKWKMISGTFSAIATLYGIYWDLVIDWGLLQPQSKNKWLRDKLLIPSKAVYFAAIVVNVLLRCAWVQTVLDLNVRFLHSQTMVAIIASLEIIRRGIWNFFRLENEHLNNVGKYRAFKSVPLPFTYNEEEDKDE